MSALATKVLSAIDLKQRNYALISDCEKYRYWLHRSWFTGTGWTVFIMLNPSTADKFSNDPTVRRCIGFAQMWGSQGVVIVNLFAGRATDPNDLYQMPDPVGPQNKLFLHMACRLAPRVICAWGAYEIANRRKKALMEIIRTMKSAPMCLGLTKLKCPQHPLFVRSDVIPVPYGR